MSAGETLSKIIVVTINIIFLLFGLAALIAGIIFKVGKWNDVSDFLNADFIKDLDLDIKTAGEALSISAIVFGSFIVVLAITGCIGACCKVKCLLVLYGIVVLILLLAEVALVILVGVKSSDVEEATKKELKKSIPKYHEDSSDKLSKSWLLIFQKFDCCGAYNVTDFKEFNGSFYAPKRPNTYQGPSYYVPITCCKKFDDKADFSDPAIFEPFNRNGCLKDAVQNVTNTQGCVDGIINSVLDHKWAFIGVGIAILVIEILVIIMAFYLCSRHDD